ncbi:hypothetical protein DOMOVOI_02450 [Brevundimonas phage vB_BpoS-Domovoi]|uniref:Uncharacterized protein n=1 Tax=Brevundimonas phage vB_BpoS-Domovoi TaxID=2948598 RepID=A0A9E7MRE4_9CAUD|nr:hypothetical protein DOMOVOI_02450 [Brevundimonas phage vB_BpoS-Domovoi]
MTVATVQWNTKRTPAADPKAPVVLDKYTRRGTERIIREDEVKDPSDGFARQFGEDRLKAIRRLSSKLRKGETAEGLTLIRRTAAPGVIYTFTFQDGARTIYVTLKGRDVVCFSADPYTAAVHATQYALSFEPDVDLSRLTLNEKLALTKRWSFQIRRHAVVIQQMNYDRAFGRYTTKTDRYRAYAAAHGLRIIKTPVTL